MARQPLVDGGYCNIDFHFGGLAHALTQRLQLDNAPRDLVFTEHERERRSAAIGSAELRLEIAAAEIELDATTRRRATQFVR
jgi:hypothetical protein